MGKNLEFKMTKEILNDFIDLNKLEGKGEWNPNTLPIFFSDFYSLIFILANDDLEILAYSETNRGKFIRYKDCIESCDRNYFLNLILNKAIICREWFFQGKIYMVTFHDRFNNNKIICKRFEPWINLKELLNIRITSIFEIGFVVTSSDSYNEFNLF
jgi:hypothetical protein